MVNKLQRAKKRVVQTLKLESDPTRKTQLCIDPVIKNSSCFVKILAMAISFQLALAS